MESKGLLFIPDISGFTQFVNQTEIEHTRLIIQELLETLINSNQMGLEVSEIEGDAILFYKFGEVPSLEDLYRQVEKMFFEFHSQLIAYDSRRFCYCKACNAAIGLTLKVVTHYGEFTGYNVKTFSKLIGKDVIVAHQLLKNDIVQHEYWLVTQSLLKVIPPDHLTEWMKWNSSVKQTETGQIPFHYTQLGELKKHIPPDVVSTQDFSDKAKMISLTKEYQTDIITLFHATGDFHYRSRWMEGVQAVKEVEHFLPRIGMRCLCIRDDGQTVIFASSYSYHPERIEFTETEESSQNLSYFLLEKTGDNTARLTLDYYIPKSLPKQIYFKLFQKKKMEDDLRKSLSNVDQLVKEIQLPELAC